MDPFISICRARPNRASWWISRAFTCRRHSAANATAPAPGSSLETRNREPDAAFIAFSMATRSQASFADELAEPLGVQPFEITATAGVRDGETHRTVERGKTGEIVDEIACERVRIRFREALLVELQRRDIESERLSLFRQFHLQHDRHRGGALDRQRVVSDEVAQRVSDQLSLVALDTPQHVRAVTDDQIGAEVDRLARERKSVAAVLAKKRLLVIA